MRNEAQAVVIGGGVGGASIAYHLARLGWKDVVLVEQYDLTSGSTWHSAGLVGQLRSSVSLTRMMMYSVGLYADLRRETGKDPGWHEVGGLRLASSPDRMDELRRQEGWAETFGLPLELITASDARERFPLMSLEGVLGAAWLPQDGYLDPSQLTFALADGARRYGAEIVTRTRVTDITLNGGRVHEVVTDKGTIRTDVVVNAGGMAAPDIARLVGVTVPIIPMAHQYLVTEPFSPALEPLPTLRDPDNLVYFRTEVGGLVMGGYERDPAPFGARRDPRRFEAQLLTEDWDRFEELMAGRAPARAGDRARGGQALLQRPRGVHPRRRVHPRRERGARVLGRRGLLRARHSPARAASARSWPSGSSTASPSTTCGTWTSAASGATTARSATRSPARPRSTRSTTTSTIRARSARRAGRCASRRLSAAASSSARPSARSRAGSARTGSSRTPPRGDESLRPRGWAGRNWSPAIGAECLATRDAAALFDESSFAKIDVHGPGALAFLDGLCANLIDRPVGTVVYTQLLNRRGGIECDLTVTRLADDRFQLVTGTAFGAHDLGWLRRARSPPDGTSTSTTSRPRAPASACGARARATILQALTKTDLAHEAFPYLRAREIAVGYVPCLALRVTYVGELGYELYCPTEYGLALWDALMAAGEPHGLVAGGLPRDRQHAPGEGLPRVGHRHHARDDARGGRARLRGPPGQAVAVRRPRRAARRAGGRRGPAAQTLLDPNGADLGLVDAADTGNLSLYEKPVLLLANLPRVGALQPHPGQPLGRSGCSSSA